MILLIDRCLRRSRLAEGLVEDWQIEHKQAMLACDIEELARECHEVAKLTCHVWERVSEALFEAKIDDVDAYGEMLRLLFEKTLGLLERLAGLIAEAQANNHAIENADDILSSLQAVRRSQEHFKKVWPTANLQMAKDALEEYNGAEYLTSEELLAQNLHLSQSP